MKRKQLFLFYLFSFAENFSVDLAIWNLFFIQVTQLSQTQAVFLHTLIFISLGISDLPTSSWADRFGRKRVARWGLLCRILGAALTISFPKSFGTLCMAGVITGIGWALVSGSLEALVFDNLKATGEAHRYPSATSNAMGWGFLARAIGFGVGGVLFSIQPSLPYLVMIALLLAGVVTLFFLEEQPFKRSVATNNLDQIFQAGRALAGKQPLISSLAFYLYFAVISNCVWLILQPLFTAKGCTPTEIGLVYSLGAIASVVGTQLAKYLLISPHARYTKDWIALCFTSGMWILALLPTMLWMIVGLAFYSLGWGLLYPVRNSEINGGVESRYRATSLSLYSSTQLVITGIVGSFVGLFIESFSITTLLLACGSLSIFGYATVLMRR